MKHMREFFMNQPEQSYKKSDVILHQGETCENVLFITDGFVKTYTIADDGDEKLIAILGPGDVMNLEAALFANHDHRYYFEAMADGKLRILEAKQLEKKLEKNPAALFGLVRYLMTRNDELAQTLDNILQAKADIKLVNMLALLVQRFGQELSEGMVTLPFTLSHAQLASMVGTTRETMTVQVRQLTKRGVLKPAKSGLFRNHKSGFEINLAKLREMTDVD
jgi:CRP/FNR family transcriptional regulator